MAQTVPAWSHQQRLARGWPVAEMARQLRKAARDGGDRTVPGNDAMSRSIRRWESGTGGVSERHQLHYCRAFGLPAGQFGLAALSNPNRRPNGPNPRPARGAASSAALAAPGLRRQGPRDTVDLYFLLGGINGLMSQAAQDLGYSLAAEELARAGWAYANVIDHQ